MKQLILYLFVAQLIHFSVAQANCKNRQGKKGVCIPLSTCRDFNLGQRVEPADKCDFSKSVTFVCCSSNELTKKANLIPTPGGGQCGIDTSDRIFGGTTTTIDEFPWMALLKYVHKSDGRSGFFCGGVLISSRYVLSAAHCIIENYNLRQVRLGEWDTSTALDCDSGDCADPVQDINVESIFSPKTYDFSKNNEHDIALLRLARPARMSYFVKPICLPLVESLMGNSRDASQKFVVAGWGKTEKLQKSDRKLKLQLGGVEHDACKKKYASHKDKVIISSSQVCAGGEKGKDSCQGDSGGPLMGLYNDGRGGNYYYLAGIVSFGIGCGNAGWPGVYTRVSSYINWIQSNMRE